VTFPLALYFWNHPQSFSGRAAQVSVFSMPNPWLHILENCWAVAQMFYWRGDLDWKNNIPGEPELFLPVGILFAVGLWMLLSTMVRGDRARDHSSFPYTLMLMWMATGAAASIFTQDQIHALRTSLMIPPVFLVAGLGAQRVYTWMEGALPRGVRIAGVVGFVWLVCYQPFPKYFRDWAGDANVEFWFSAWLTEEAKEIHNAPPVPAKYVVVPNAKNGERDVAPGQVPRTVIFLTQASTMRDRERSNVHFVLPGANDPGGAEFCAQVKKQHEGDQVFCVANDLPLRP
jgi:hypothetical protein